MSAGRAIKRWPGWVVLVLVVAGLLAVGATRSSGPTTPEERVESIAKRLACPTCDGESVYESRAPASQNIRDEIVRQVRLGQASDAEIIAYIERSYEGEVLLVPRATGIDALVWALPAAALVCAVAGLAVAFARWRNAADTVPTEADRDLVAAALAREETTQR